MQAENSQELAVYAVCNHEIMDSMKKGRGEALEWCRHGLRSRRVEGQDPTFNSGNTVYSPSPFGRNTKKGEKISPFLSRSVQKYPVSSHLSNRIVAAGFRPSIKERFYHQSPGRRQMSILHKFVGSRESRCCVFFFEVLLIGYVMQISQAVLVPHQCNAVIELRSNILKMIDGAMLINAARLKHNYIGDIPSDLIWFLISISLAFTTSIHKRCS